MVISWVFQVLPAIPTQIEEPPSEEEASEEDEASVEESEEVEEDNGWDVDYKVNRPTSAPDADEEEESGCTRNYAEEEEGDKDCVVAGKDLTPYRKYKSYAKWQRRPLFVIIIGG